MRFSISEASRRLAADGPERTDATMHLGDADLIELHGGTRDLTDSTARFYADVVLRGAMLASEQRKQTLLPESQLPTDATMHLGDADLLSLAAPGELPDVTARLYPEVSLRGASLPGKTHGKAPRSSWLDSPDRPAPDPLGVVRPTVAGQVSEVARLSAATLRRLFEPGHVAPTRLVAGGFVAGFAVATLLAILI